MEIHNKVAIVTGAGGGGSGRAVALRLAHDGASVVVSDIDEAGGRETVRRIAKAGGRAEFYRANVGVEAEMRALFAFATSTFGGVDILVNGAGPYFPQTLAQWAETVQGNLLGTMYSTLCAVEAFRHRGGGAIVNFGSTSALSHGPDHSPSPAYDAAKAGIMRLTTTLGGLKASHNIRVNCLVPHWIATEEVAAYVNGLTPEQRRQGNVPDHLLSVEEVADAVVRLVRDENLAGRIAIYRGGESLRFIRDGDPGYAALTEMGR